MRKLGATTDETGAWQIPHHVLVAMHLLDKVQPISNPSNDTPCEPNKNGEGVTEEALEIVRLKSEVEKWQTIAAEREKHIEDMRRSMRLLEPPKAVETTEDEQAQIVPLHPVPNQVMAPSRRRWWQRRAA